VQVINTLPFLMTGLHPSQSRFTDDRVFMPRTCDAAAIDIEFVAGYMGCRCRAGCRRRREEKRRDVDLVRSDGCGWRR
jgi:hypothetical protein